MIVNYRGRRVNIGELPKGRLYNLKSQDGQIDWVNVEGAGITVRAIWLNLLSMKRWPLSGEMTLVRSNGGRN